MATSPDSVLYVNLSEVAWVGSLLRLLAQNTAAKVEKKRRDAYIVTLKYESQSDGESYKMSHMSSSSWF